MENQTPNNTPISPAISATKRTNSSVLPLSLLLLLSLGAIGFLGYRSMVLSQQVETLTQQQLEQPEPQNTLTDTYPVDPTAAPVTKIATPFPQTGTFSEAKYGGVFSYNYPTGWHVAELWPYQEGGAINIVMDPRPITTAPRDGVLGKITVNLFNGLPNPEDRLTALKAMFNPELYTDVVTEVINSTHGPIYYYSGKVKEEYLAGTKIENYVFSLKKTPTDPYNEQVMHAQMMNGSKQESDLLRQIVLSFKML